MKAEDIMSKNVISISVPGKRRIALEVMKKKNVSGLPVTKGDTDELAGFVSIDDLMRNPDEDQLAMIMRRDVETITPKTSIEEIAKIILEKGVRSLPVVVKGHLKGIVSIDDVIKRGIARMKFEKPCQNFVNKNVLAIWQRTPMPVAMKIMNYSNSRAALVLDNHGVLVGIVDTEDFLRASEIINEMERSDIVQQTEGEDWVWETKSTLYIGTERLKLPNKGVMEFMTYDVKTVTENTSVTDCARVMRKYDIEQIPVVTGRGEVVGMIRDIDLLRVLVEK